MRESSLMHKIMDLRAFYSYEEIKRSLDRVNELEKKGLFHVDNCYRKESNVIEIRRNANE